MPRLSVDEAQKLRAPAGTYLNTASYGLPPRPATGEVADLAGIAAAAAEYEVRSIVDATQAVGWWLPLEVGRFDVVVAHADKWLMSARGTAFMSIRPERMERVVPHAAGWCGGEDPLATFFGAPLRLAVLCDVEAAAEAREGANPGRHAVRGGRLRTSWHAYNSHVDVERTLDVLSG
jgi:selenocysteine lyase/cysteine desulfurase